ncbi:hypothetical protein BC938DRAFT_476866 [Jimgerdemannia flammicorona]|uniref:NAD(P)-binding domain-containing protein n=1 Tax=Jimgerdemannia flammicorona TaxID=994334 RepID=A0A433PDR0_9FUNG|nr:hypothetical protein BC938DRAFT_476866 [Jimgerdemannia flammicorona]
MSTAAKLLLIGGTGLIGSAVARQASSYNILVLSRTGAPLTSSTLSLNIQYYKGSALDPFTFRSLLTNTSTVVHTVGTIANQKNYGDQGTYEKLNRDAVVTVARELAASAADEGKKKCLVYFSAASAPPGWILDKRYIGTKREAEKILMGDEFKDQLRVVIFRPGWPELWQYYEFRYRCLPACSPLTTDCHEYPFVVPIAFGAIFASVLFSPFKSHIPDSLTFLTDRPVSDKVVSKAVLRAVEQEDVEGVVDIAKIQELALEWSKVHRK